MYLIACLDDKRGMSFRSRRQSKDRTVIADVLELSKGRILRMSPYSAQQFPLERVIAEENFLENAQIGDACFVENIEVTPYLLKANTIVLYYWNRYYPADMYFPTLEAWRCVEERSFQGFSHETITRKVYQR